MSLQTENVKRDISRRRRRKRSIARAMGAAARPLVPARACAVRTEPAGVLAISLLRIGDTVTTEPALRALAGLFPRARMSVLVSAGLAPLVRAFEAASEANVEVVAAPETHGAAGLAALGRRLARERHDLAVVLDPTPKAALLAWLSAVPLRLGYGSPLTTRFFTLSVPAPSAWNVPAWETNGSAVPHQVDAWRSLVGELGSVDATDGPRLRTDRLPVDKMRALLDDMPGDGPAVLIHPGSSPSYQWRPERFARVGQMLVESLGARICVTGSPDDRSLCERVAGAMKSRSRSVRVTAGDTTLLEQAALAHAADLVICVDTSAGHIADAAGTPVVALFGPGDPAIWRPFSARNRVVRAHRSPCVGCKAPRCAQDRHYCMDGIGIEDVLTQAREAMGDAG